MLGLKKWAGLGLFFQAINQKLEKRLQQAEQPAD